VTPVNPPGDPKPEFLFVAVRSIQSILSLGTQNPAPATKPQFKVISGIQGFLGDALAYDAANDRLFASSGANILVYDKASTLSGAVSPSRTIQAKGTGIDWPSNIAYDKTTDTLYFIGSAQYQTVLAIIGNASTASGNVVPVHSYAMASGSQAFSIDTQRKLLYGLGSTIGVFVFDLTSLQQMTGTMPNINQAVRVMAFPALGVMTGISIDQARDRLYIAGTGKLAVVNDASTAGGNPVNLSFNVPAYSTTFDPSHDRLYVGTANAAYIINNASGLQSGSNLPATVSLRSDSQLNYMLGGFAFP